MKTLVVLTDFSLKAENTAFYALSLARHIKADIYLCHVLPTRLASNLDTPLDQHPDHLDAMYDLAELAGRLRKILTNNILPGQFNPVVTCGIKIGKIGNILNDIGAERDVTMVVIGARQSGRWMSLLMGSNTTQLIENTSYPVLVVPYESQFRDLKTIAFATDLTSSSADALLTLSDLAGHSGAEIVITYIADKKLIERKDTTQLQNFFDLVTKQIMYPKKRYQVIHDKKVVRGLRKLTEKINVDLIAIVHRKRNYIQQLFGTSISLIMTNFLVRPMLIFPLETSLKNEVAF